MTGPATKIENLGNTGLIPDHPGCEFCAIPIVVQGFRPLSNLQCVTTRISLYHVGTDVGSSAVIEAGGATNITQTVENVGRRNDEPNVHSAAKRVLLI